MKFFGYSYGPYEKFGYFQEYRKEFLKANRWGIQRAFFADAPMCLAVILAGVLGLWGGTQGGLRVDRIWWILAQSVLILAGMLTTFFGLFTWGFLFRQRKQELFKLFLKAKYPKVWNAASTQV